MALFFRQYLEPETSTFTFLIAEPETREAALVDSVKGQILTYLADIQKNNFKVTYLLETHIHADHVTGIAQLLKIFPEAQIAISEKARVTCNRISLSEGTEVKLGKIVLKALSRPFIRLFWVGARNQVACIC